MHSHILGVAIAAFVMLAGCTGQFDVVQTEPIQVEVDGEAESVRVSESDAEPARAGIDTQGLETIEIEIEVAGVSSGPVTVIVEIQGPDNETLATETMTVGNATFPPDNGTDDGTTPADTTNTTGADENDSANETLPQDNATSEPAPTEGDQTTIQTIVIDVRGKDNVVVVTQAVSGEAQVTLAAHDASASSMDGNATDGNASFP
jgi:hypothetical protein